MVKNITIFTTNTCAYCQMVKKYLGAKGMSYEEVSEIMQINYQVVRNLLCQALKTFRKLITPLVL